MKNFSVYEKLVRLSASLFLNLHITNVYEVFQSVKFFQRTTGFDLRTTVFDGKM